MKINIDAVSQMANVFVKNLDWLFKQSNCSIEEIFIFKGDEGKTHVNVKAHYRDTVTGKDMYWACVLPINDSSLKIGELFDDAE